MREGSLIKETIAEIVREEIEAMVSEAKEEIRAVVRSELMPMLRSAVRESILKELEEAAYHSQTAIAKEGVKGVVTPAAASSEDELPKAAKVGGDQGVGLYLYGIADADAQTELGQIGIEENAVYTIPSGELSAIVHNCPLEPYESDDEETVKRWVNTHQHVLEIAGDNFGTVIPFGFDRIIKPKDSIPAKEILKKWMSEEFDSLMEKMKRIRGKREYGVQIFYLPLVISEKIIEEDEEIREIKEKMKWKGAGVEYLYRQKLENAIKKGTESRMTSYSKDFLERIKKHADEIKVEETKKTGEKEKKMMMNLSCLVREDKYKELGDELEEIDKEEGFSVRFTGPWQAYSFV